jgi:large subunit ribosomal protein L15
MHFEGFEGGQSPLHRRLPKRGFLNPFSIEWAIVNLRDLETRFEAGASVDEQSLRAKGLVKGVVPGIKVLGEGALTKKLSIKVHAVSSKAKELIGKAGGSVELIKTDKKPVGGKFTKAATA